MKRTAGGIPRSIPLSSLSMAAAQHHTADHTNSLFAVLATSSGGGSGAHEGVTCDGCSTASFTGIRHKCSICFDYDLCDECYLSGVATKAHDPSHAMQTILPPASSGGISDFDPYIGGEEFEGDQLDLSAADSSTINSTSNSNTSNSNSTTAFRSSRFRRDSPPRSAGAATTFKCPYCGGEGYLEQELCFHVNSAHAGDSTPVVCPICAAKPGGDPMYISRNFHGHLELRHLQPEAKAGLFATNGTSNSLLSSNPTSRLISELAATKQKNPPAKVARLSNLPPIPVKITPPASSLLPSLEPTLTEEEIIESNNKKILKGIFLRELLYSTLVEPPRKTR